MSPNSANLRTGGRHLPPGLPGGMIGWVDRPAHGAEVAGGRISAYGWIVDPLGPHTAVAVMLASHAPVLATLGVPRPDVVELFPTLPERCGWKATFDLLDWPAPKATVHVAVCRSTGEWVTIASHDIRLAANAAAFGFVDYPAPGQVVDRGPFRLSGWAVLPDSPTRKIDVVIDGYGVFQARPYCARPDDPLGPSRPESSISGFECIVDLTALPASIDQLSVDVAVHGMDDSRRLLPSVEVTVRPPEEAFVDEDGRVAQLRARVDRAAATGGHGGDLPSVLAFTHSLSYGEGQLYLYELLRRLAGRDDFSCTVVSPESGPLAEALEKLGFPVHVTGGYPVSDEESYEGWLEEIAAWASSRAFSVVLVNTLGAFPGADLAARLGLPCVWAIHESCSLSSYWAAAYPPGSVPRYVREQMATALASAGALVFETESSKRTFAAHASPERMLTIPYGLDMGTITAYRSQFDRTLTRRRLRVWEDETVILGLGTIEPRTSQISLARAFGAIAHSHPDARLVLVGDDGGPTSDALHAYIQRSALGDRILVKPVTPNILDWYGIADVFVLSSEMESLPRSIPEAMAFDIPVVTTNIFGLPELIEDGRNGILFEPNDLRELTGAVSRILSMSEEERRSIGRSGGDTVRSAYDSQGYADAYDRLLRTFARDPHASVGESTLWT